MLTHRSTAVTLTYEYIPIIMTYDIKNVIILLKATGCFVAFEQQDRTPALANSTRGSSPPAFTNVTGLVKALKRS